MDTSFVQSRDGSRIRIGKAGSGANHVLVIPGLAEHLGRYAHVAQALVAGGYAVTVLEPRGHGRSDGRRGHVDAWTQYAEDVAAAAETIDGPLFLLGHSTGGLIALFTALEGLENPIRGLALSGPNVLDTVDAPVKKAAAGVISKLLPRLSMATGLNAEKISRDPEVVQAYKDDPMVYGTVPARFFIEMVSAQQRVTAAAPEGTLPLLLQVGEKDEIVDPAASIELAKQWKTPATIIVYPELYHEIFNEPEQDRVFADLIQWMDNQS